MELTGQCKEDFEKWLDDNHGILLYNIYPNMAGYTCLKTLPDSMQFGVLVDFFDSVGIRIIIGTGYSGYLYFYSIKRPNFNAEFDNEFQTRQEARTKAIEKADEIYNKADGKV